MSDNDTIAAIATAPGQGGIGIVRISGKAAKDICHRLIHTVPPARFAHYANFKDEENDIIDQGIVIVFDQPNSFTGEDVVELQGHGGTVVLNRLLNSVIKLAARVARAGEFSERAYHNNKIDLAQAEAIADLIAAESEQSAIAAMHSLQGEFSSAINSLVEQLTQLRVHVESALDFPEEEIDFLADNAIADKLLKIQSQLKTVKNNCKQGALLSEGVRVVITGKPNAGKSSLLNKMAGMETAIVSDIPGTTRDVLREHIQINGVALHIIDTAGVRDSDDEIEKEGVRRAQIEIDQADIIMHLVDASVEEKVIANSEKEIIVYNKIDLTETKSGSEHKSVWLSAKTGDGLDLLKTKILEMIGIDNVSQKEGMYSARTRHVVAIDRAEEHLNIADVALHKQQAGEIMAEELRMAQNELASITGEFSNDDLLGKIFSEFCIGK